MNSNTQVEQGKGFWSVQPRNREEQEQALRSIQAAGLPIAGITVAVRTDAEADRLDRSGMTWNPVHFDQDGPQLEQFNASGQAV